MVVLMALVSLTRTQAQSPIYMVAVPEAGSPTGLVSASSSDKFDLAGCDSSIVSAVHIATSADGFSGPSVPSRE